FDEVGRGTHVESFGDLENPSGSLATGDAHDIYWGGSLCRRPKSGTATRRPSRRLFENLGEEACHFVPRALVRLLTVGHAFGTIVAGHRLGERVNGSTIKNDLPVHAALAHFVFKRVDVLRRGKTIVGTVQHQHLAFDVLAVVRMGRIQAAMETH